MRKLTNIVAVLGVALFLPLTIFAAGKPIKPEYPATKQITISSPGNPVGLVIGYLKGVVIKQLTIKGVNMLSPSGIFTGVSLQSGKGGTSYNSKPVSIRQEKNKTTISGIIYGDNDLQVNETWEFMTDSHKINWRITREYNNDAELDDTAFPKWSFNNTSTWTGGILDNGGMVWCKYLKGVNDTYGVHTGGVTLWNAKTGVGLRIKTQTGNGQTAARYSHSDKNEFTINHVVSDDELNQRYNLSRFVNGRELIFAPFKVHKGKVVVNYELAYVNYDKQYSRGKLPGIDAIAVRELLNTTARYGVVDSRITGGNGWLSNWKCMHEPFFAQIGMAVDDPNYTNNLSVTLDQERDEAIKPDGRVLSRWHNVQGDEMPGTYNKKTGYYEAMWGYTVDSQTGYIINVCEQFDVTGKIDWLKSHRQSCENALGWLIARDSDHNGIFEMMNNSRFDHTSSDWLDIVWASYENAFVNAQMYRSLVLWADCEQTLGDTEKAKYYSSLAAKLKTAFNKPIEDGGFWSAKAGQYVYWRDKDGSTHGDNMVTPVNFAAIAFGICDDPTRKKIILDNIEKRMQSEHLFHWPLCFDSFKQDEVSGGNWPFPKYENGDIFPTWGYLGIRSYAEYDRAIALKYIHNILQQYNKDGLSSQRYSRVTQLGQGDDVLSGICTTITALYSDIYGIRPKWNRMGLEPNMSPELNGTDFYYTLRDTAYRIRLSTGEYNLSTKGFAVSSKEDFGASQKGNHLSYYHLNKDSCILNIDATAKSINLTVNKWSSDKLSFTIKNPGRVKGEIKGLTPNSYYEITAGNAIKKVKTTNLGVLSSVWFSSGKLDIDLQRL
ncbi:hypothetical protein [Mucilaginibacter sp. dw_454]|uniref:alpha-L-rhamnosidase-related protein n=1 Tax=Mucilaginibacter sp. dw_454 TaxID=2720079 RepID=UPI001BD308C5|nr:hypothetical protein [Mucilaginibacter sp. dw_454]